MSSNESDNYEWSFNELRMLKYMLEKDGIQFMRYFFKIREGNKLVLNWHHFLIQYVLDAVLKLDITRLIINIAPGYGKTEQAVINFIARGLAINPRSKFIQTSFSDILVGENSSKIKDTITSKEFQDLWPMKLRSDKKGKKMWFTEFGGGVLTAPSRGQITGFRAGRMEPGIFNGAFIVDDPVKPVDANSETLRKSINNAFNSMARSRLALPETPMIVIMQRIHDDDMSGYLLRGGSGDKWFHLSIPSNFTEEVLETEYNKEYTHGIQLNINDILRAIRNGRNLNFREMR